MGFGKCVNSKLLTQDFKKVTAIDGSKKALEKLKKRIKSKNLNTIHGYFEDIQIDEKFDTIVMGHIMEHVVDPVLVMEKYKNNLTPNGRIIISVPNANSYHRIAAVKMGLLQSVYELNENDIKIGHRRVYDFPKLKKDIKKAGLKLIKREGYWIKLLPNIQIQEQWSKDQIKVYMGMGRDYPEHAAEIIAICSK